MLLRTCSLLVFGLLFACRQEKMLEVKNFRIFVDSNEPSLHTSIERLTHQYNEEYGSPILTLVKTETESNSVIRFKENLRLDGQKLGTGQWLTTTTTSKAMSLHGEVATNRVEFGMELVFDEGNFLTKSAMAADRNSNEGQHLYHLFCHEVGHGMQMNHSEDKHNVMYPTIPEKPNREIDYDGYFRSAQAFAGHAAHTAANAGAKPAFSPELSDDLEERDFQVLEEALR